MYFQLERHLDNVNYCIPLLFKYVKRMFCNSAFLRILFHNLKVITSFTDDKDTTSFAVQNGILIVKIEIVSVPLKFDKTTVFLLSY